MQQQRIRSKPTTRTKRITRKTLVLLTSAAVLLVLYLRSKKLTEMLFVTTTSTASINNDNNYSSSSSKRTVANNLNHRIDTRYIKRKHNIYSNNNISDEQTNDDSIQNDANASSSSSSSSSSSYNFKFFRNAPRTIYATIEDIHSYQPHIKMRNNRGGETNDFLEDFFSHEWGGVSVDEGGEKKWKFFDQFATKTEKVMNHIGSKSGKRAKSYDDEADKLDVDGCSATDWQRENYQVCNLMHEFSLQTAVGDLHSQYGVMVGRGTYRNVWSLDDDSSMPFVVKTQTFHYEYTIRNIDRSRRDAMAAGQLAASDYIVKIYGFCGTDSFFEYGDEGTVSSYRKAHYNDKRSHSLRELKIALDVASGLADFHSIDGDRHATIAHNDIKPDQFVLINGTYKLNDFNKSTFILWNGNKQCRYPNRVQIKHTKKGRSPEEYAGVSLTEKVDVYSMGNVFYSLLTGLSPFVNVDTAETHERIMNGERPNVKIDGAEHPARLAVVNAMKMCYIHQPAERKSAREVATYLKHEYDRLVDN